MRDDVKALLDERNVQYSETVDMYDALRGANVVYWTRMQKERMKDEDRAIADNFVIDARALEVMENDAIIMHPLPNAGEIAKEVDDDPRARYFQQARNGLYVRMHMLDAIMRAS